MKRLASTSLAAIGLLRTIVTTLGRNSWGAYSYLAPSLVFSA